MRRANSSVKGQTSIEFFLLFGMAMAVMTVLFAAIQTKESDVMSLQNQKTAAQIGEKVGKHVEKALEEGKGYSRKFRVPDRIAGSKYNLTVTNKTVVVRWGGGIATADTIYSGEKLKLSTRSTNLYKVIHDEKGVKFVER